MTLPFKGKTLKKGSQIWKNPSHPPFFSADLARRGGSLGFICPDVCNVCGVSGTVWGTVTVLRTGDI